MRDWNDAFANLAYIPGGEALLADTAQEAAAFRSTAKASLDQPYGEAERTKYDLFLPEKSVPNGVMIFVHGGYWMQTSRADWSQYARAALDRGFAACLPGYTLAPQARLTQIAQEIGQAIINVADAVPGPIYLCGHSAGGHLVARMACDDSPLPDAVRNRIQRVMPISGVFDLRPLLHTDMNQTLQIDQAEAASESPVLRRPSLAAPLVVWVGVAERPEFVRQSRLLTMMWQGLDAEIRLVEEAGTHHFSVLDGLKDGRSPLAKALFEG